MARVWSWIRARPKLCEYSVVLLLFLPVYAVNVMFSYGWVKGNSRELGNDFFRENIWFKLIYAFFMVTVNALTVCAELSYFREPVRHYLKKPFFAVGLVFSLLVFSVAHIGAPFIASDVMLVMDWNNACDSYVSSLLLHPGGDSRLKFNGKHISTITGVQQITEPDADHTRLQFTVKEDWDAELSKLHSLSNISITVDRNGFGMIVGDCAGGESHCVSGSVSFIEGQRYVSFLLTWKSTGVAKSFSTSDESSWFDNPIGVSSFGKHVARSVVRLFDEDVQICSNDVDISIALAAVVASPFQRRAQICHRRWSDCVNCCSQTCFSVPITSTSCSGTSGCTSSTTNVEQCDCQECQNEDCHIPNQDTCKGIGLPF